MLRTYYSDLHIHIGRDKYNKPVKITGSKHLTLTRILQEASRRKGLDLIGVVDTHAPAVQEELQDLIDINKAKVLQDGGIQYESVTLILGVELEVYDHNCLGPIHVLCYFKDLKTMRAFTEWLKPKMTNIHLSSQRIYHDAHTLQRKVKELSGLFIPAHVFTPFKSLFGKGVKKSLAEVFIPEFIDAIELGLSSDTMMAEAIDELKDYPFLTNSDAHSLIKMAREYQTLKLKACSFKELKYALKAHEGRRIIANYGMHPYLGKYYQSICRNCGHGEFKDSTCLKCQKNTMIKGVSERIDELSGDEKVRIARPPYHYHVPLDYLHGLGKKTYQKLLEHFKTEMAILHDAKIEDISKCVGARIAKQLSKIRRGEVEINKGGGGKYGSIIE